MVNWDEPLVVVRVSVEIQDVLRVAVSEPVQDGGEPRFAGVVPGRVSGAVAKGDDEMDLRARLSSREKTVSLRGPAGPGRIGVRLRIGDEADAAGVEPAPVLPAAPLPRRLGRCLPMRDQEPSLVIA